MLIYSATSGLVVSCVRDVNREIVDYQYFKMGEQCKTKDIRQYVVLGPPGIYNIPSDTDRRRTLITQDENWSKQLSLCLKKHL